MFFFFNHADVFITPPENHNHSDEDSGEEDGGGSINNLSRNQLLATAVATVTHHGGEIVAIGGIEGTSTSGPDTIRLPCNDTSNTDCISVHNDSLPQKKANRVWVKRDRPKSKLAPEWNGETPKHLTEDLSPVELFELFFDDQVIEMIVEMSNLYALQKGKANFSVTKPEMRVFLAILFISGYVPLPRRRMFWENENDVINQAVTQGMSINRFEEIMSNIHCADNTNLPQGDKLGKMRPVFDLLNKRFLKFWPVEQNLDIDEAMLPYYGRHSAKQFLRGKPICWGYKIWCLNTHLGYLLQFDPYCGASPKYHPELGLGGSVVMSLIKSLPKDLNYRLYFDNFFPSLYLFDVLYSQHILATGTIRANRIEQCPLKAVDAMKKEERGSFDFRREVSDSDLVICRWNDNSVVTIASTAFGVNTLQTARRWSRSQKQHIEIVQTQLVSNYNTYMGGTDRMDQNIGSYRIGIRSKKWWWPFFAFLPDVAMQNAWLLYRRSPAHKTKTLSLLDFRREVVKTYILSYASRPAIGRQMGKPQLLDKRVPLSVRRDGKEHLVDAIEKPRRCATCNKNTMYKCIKCEVGLHPRFCFRLFHC
ncbi:piggyBac transposable element-derived protein 3-like [Acipenser oxyrinchus oxyrinchus]|uniref:PiggyBac transposable element-derived protein 3-like n=1 Tax=Acipenser oxyrinchus oxyrinchus TaxID=40147 RepID=A0AAD8GC31_ACIOX|nr:piggyBac transposable element-derived protein 3-like [Acipenser oxyrinchus oxyrinchus]